MNLTPDSNLEFQLEDLPYQQHAIDSVVELFSGQCITSPNSALLYNSARPEINSNICNLDDEQLHINKLSIIKKNSLEESETYLSDERRLCIEMETGTGKTLVYIRTIYELNQKFNHTKFIIVVPSIAVKEGIINTLQAFKSQLKDRYKKTIHWFEYDSSKLNPLKHFIMDDQPQIMLTTIQAFAAEDRILNQKNRDDNIGGMSYLEALGETHPFVIMDEPQEGMDTDLAQERLQTLNPLFELRYSATHKRIVNRLYRLTPIDAYQQGLVKKIEVLSVAEINDEATLKIELTDIQAKQGQNPKAKLNLWHQMADGYKFKVSKWLKQGDNLSDVTNNISYQDFTIERIHKSMRDQYWRIEFSNGVELKENEKQGDIEGLFRLQLYWLINSHFQKKEKLAKQGIKCLSLIFIDKVDNYLSSGDEEAPLIKRLFIEEYERVYKEVHSKKPDANEIEATQGYYFARTGGGDFTDNENSMKKNKAIYDLILKDKRELLSQSNPVEFIFSHSALGVGWDNPNIFNIATLNQSYSEIKKRQEIGRGLRICVNQKGERIYDPDSVDADKEINLLSIVPNESYETFAAQYQEQIEDAYGDKGKGQKLRKNIKGKKKPNILKRIDERYNSDDFKHFWNALAKKTKYTVSFNETVLIKRAVEAINNIKVKVNLAEVMRTRITGMENVVTQAEYQGSDTQRLKASFSSIDLIEELSETTSLSYRTVIAIVKQLDNLDQLLNNPPQYILEASNTLKRIELDEMIRTLAYKETGDSYSIDDFKKKISTFAPVEPTPTRGIYDHAICDADSTPEHDFARNADIDPQVVCFLKLPDFYKIPTPIGNYQPDFGLVIKHQDMSGSNESQLYIVIETKGTNNINDTHALTDDERTKIKCAIKHFEALGISANVGNGVQYEVKDTSHAAYANTKAIFQAPVKDYQSDFKDHVK